MKMLGFDLEDIEKKGKLFVTTPGDYKGYKDGDSMPNKNMMMKNVKDTYKIPYNNMVFFDDSERNVYFARLLDVKSHLVCGKTGITRKMWDSAVWKSL